MLASHRIDLTSGNTNRTAAEYFGLDESLWTEEFLRGKLESKEGHDIYYALLALRTCGSSTSVENVRRIVDRFAKSDRRETVARDIPQVGLLTLGMLCKEACTDYYATFLEAGDLRSLAPYALWCLNLFGSPSAVDATINYFRCRGFCEPEHAAGDIVHGAFYLARHLAERKACRETLIKLLEHWPKLCAREERQWAQEREQELAG